MHRTVVVACGCLLLSGCGGRVEQGRAVDAGPSPIAITSTVAPGAATPPPDATPAQPPAAPPSPPARPVGAPSAGPASSPAAPLPPSPSATPHPDHGAVLWNTRWRAVERTSSGEPRPFLEGGAWTARFDSATARVLAWRGACNSTGAAVAVSERVLTVGERGASTAIGCPVERLVEDERAAAFFESDPSWSRRGDTLWLTSDDITLRLVRVPDEQTSSPSAPP